MQLKIIKYVHYLFSKSISSLYKYMCGGWGNFLRGSFLGSNSHGAVFRGNFLGAGFLESFNYIGLVFLRKGQHNFFFVTKQKQSLMLYIKIQPQSFIGSGEEDL